MLAFLWSVASVSWYPHLSCCSVRREVAPYCIVGSAAGCHLPPVGLLQALQPPASTVLFLNTKTILLCSARLDIPGISFRGMLDVMDTDVQHRNTLPRLDALGEGF